MPNLIIFLVIVFFVAVLSSLCQGWQHKGFLSSKRPLLLLSARADRTQSTACSCSDQMRYIRFVLRPWLEDHKFESVNDTLYREVSGGKSAERGNATNRIDEYILSLQRPFEVTYEWGWKPLASKLTFLSFPFYNKRFHEITWCRLKGHLNTSGID